MRVKLKDLHPNPYRNMEEYPVDAEKVEALKQSINETGFWDNILTREHEGEIQLAYGHHRLVALMDMYDGEHELNVITKDLSDAMMLKIMANENMEDYNMTPAVLNQTVKSVRDYLNEELGKEEVDSVLIDLLELGGRSALEKTKTTGVGQGLILKFLGKPWTQSKIQFALEALGMFEADEPIVEQETVESLKSVRHQQVFLGEVKKREGMGITVSKEKQKEIVSSLPEGAGYRQIEDAFVGAGFKQPKPKKKKIDIQTIVTKAGVLASDFRELLEIIDTEFGNGNLIDPSNSRGFLHGIKKLQKDLNKFIIKTEQK